MSTSAIIAFLDVGLQLVDRLSQWAELKRKADAEGRALSLDDVRAVRAGFTPLLAELDAAIAAAEVKAASQDP